MTAAGLYAAMAAANVELTNPTKDKKAQTGQYTYTYASLDTILGHVRPVLAKHGLSVLQDVVIEGDRVQIITKILHASGELLEFGPLGGPVGRDWQALGGGITYARRYALCAALGIAADEDDDAQHASTPIASSSTSTSSAGAHNVTTTARGPLGRAQARDAGAAATPRQIGMVRGLMKDQKVTEPVLSDFTRERLGFELPVDGLEHLTKQQASAIIEAMAGAKPVTRTTEPDQHDPWAGAPLVDPASGEVAT